MDNVKKALLTNEEKNILDTLTKYNGGYLRRYTETQYRLVDSKINPISNFTKTKVQSLVEKGYLELLSSNEFRIK